MVNKNATEDVHIEFPEFAPSAIPVPDAPIVGKFLKLLRGPESDQGFRRPTIVEFEAVSGSARRFVDGDVTPLEIGNTFSLWLLHDVILDRFMEARPEKGERFALKYLGRIAKKDALKAGRDGTDKEDQYHGYAFVMPDRDVVDDEITWDELYSTHSPK